jgi:hypothetical protein
MEKKQMPSKVPDHYLWNNKFFKQSMHSIKERMVGISSSQIKFFSFKRA